MEKQSASFQLIADPVHKTSLTQQFTGGEDYHYKRSYHMASENSEYKFYGLLLQYLNSAFASFEA